uniref:substrate-binding periplasmic protein n=1 Tax=uncultured Sphingomonas sp. TaxID=158754 RepID=UPI0026001FF3|nr:transporter substrate-binding domain-containing protein [uncultured Sphingomonas sp.]
MIRSIMAGAMFLAMACASSPAHADATEIEVPRPGASQRIDAIKQRGVLRVAVLDEYPWLKRSIAGAAPFHGPAWRLAEEYATRLGVRIETVEVEFANKVSILADGGADITIAPLLRTPARERIVDMISYSMAAHCAFGRADNPKVARALTLDDLNRPDITIGSIENTPQGAWLQGRLPEAKSRAVPGNLADLATDEVLSGRADVAPIDKFFFAGLARRLPGLVTVPKGDACLASNELSIAIGMAVSKGQPEFTAWLRGVADAIKPQVEAEQTRVTKADH